MDANSVMDCRMQRHARCETDGSFSDVQCMGPRCYCANTETGERLNEVTFSMRERDTFDCSAGEEE